MAKQMTSDTSLLREYHTWLRLERGYSPNTVEAYEMDLDKLREYATEHGIVYLRNLPLADRAKALISIADPSVREELERAAVERFGIGFLRLK